jgi:hypothetical protein
MGNIGHHANSQGPIRTSKKLMLFTKLLSSSDPHQLAFYLTYILTISGILSGILSGTLSGSRTRKHQPATAFWNFFKRGRETGNRYSGNKAPSQP